jgi:hypothetical protein
VFAGHLSHVCHAFKRISLSSGISCSCWSSVAKNSVGEFYFKLPQFCTHRADQPHQGENKIRNRSQFIKGSDFGSVLRLVGCSSHSLFSRAQVSFESQKAAMMEQQQALAAKSIGLQEQVIELQKVAFLHTNIFTPTHGNYNIPLSLRNI